MFTGIVQTTGDIVRIDHKVDDSRFVFNTGEMQMQDMKLGDSISVNGVCLSIIEINTNSFTADLSKETLSLTTFSTLKVGSRINLEKAMMLSDRINGHMVSGHVDGIGNIKNKEDVGRSIKYTIEYPEQLNKFISKKGSISVDGVSLTINDVNKNLFSVNIIPHTLSETIFSEYNIDTKVNLEVDQIARYLDKLINK